MDKHFMIFTDTYKRFILSGQFIVLGMCKLEQETEEMGTVDMPAIICTNGTMTMLEVVDTGVYYLRPALQDEKDRWKIYQLDINPISV